MIHRSVRALLVTGVTVLAATVPAPALTPEEAVPIHVTGRMLSPCISEGGCAYLMDVVGASGEPISIELEQRDGGILLPATDAPRVMAGPATITTTGWVVSDDLPAPGQRVLERVFARCSIPAEIPADPRGLEVTLVATHAACLLEAVPSTRAQPGDPQSPPSGLLTLRPLPESVDPDRARPPLFDVEPASVRGIPEDVVFSLTLGHCGLGSPIDVDGSVWDPVGGLDAFGEPIDSEEEVGELINATAVSAIIASVGRLDLRTPLGSVVVLARHDGPRDYPGCD
jgi:hypothetical protein